MPSHRRVVIPRLALLAIVTLGTASCIPWPFGCRQERPDPSVAVPDSFRVAFETTRGRFDVMARKNWAPIGVDRFYTLLKSHYYDETRFFRVVRNFVAQFGMSGDPRVSEAWRVRCIADEPVRHTNARGTIAYARGGPGTRSVQLFVNLRDNPRLVSNATRELSGTATLGSGRSCRQPNGHGMHDAKASVADASTTSLRTAARSLGMDQREEG